MTRMSLCHQNIVNMLFVQTTLVRFPSIHPDQDCSQPPCATTRRKTHTSNETYQLLVYFTFIKSDLLQIRSAKTTTGLPLYTKHRQW